MALWGAADAKTSTGTIAITTGGAVTGSSTLFDSEAAVGDYIVANNNKYRITAIASNTAATVVGGTNGGSITAVTAGTGYSLQEMPIYVSASEVGGVSNNVFGVDTTEAGVTQAAGHAGWVRRTAGSGGRAGRVQYEVLVAGSMITGDATASDGDADADDTEFPDS